MFNLETRGEVMEKVTTVGIDLAKNVFSLHGVDANGKVVFKRTVRRAQLVETVASLPSCVIGMEACSGSHAWARRFEGFGHRCGCGPGVRGAVSQEWQE
jgi:transposase